MTAVTGAYGLRITGMDHGEALLGPVPEHFPHLHMTFEPATRRVETTSIDDDRAVFALDRGRSLVIDRSTFRATYSGRGRPLAADLVHPLLTAAAAAVGRWSGYALFHAAAFVCGGRVWAVLGDKEAGKSTVVAAMAQRGYPIVCDDLLAIAGPTAFAGPRFVDLRPAAARHLGVGARAESEGGRERWRLTPGPIAAELVFGGWVVLAWGDVVEAVPIPAGQLLRRLTAHRTWRGLPFDPVAVLDLVTLPAWELRRPRGWASFGLATSTLEAVTTNAARDATSRCGLSHG